MTHAFDTLAYAQRLREAGLDQKVAEAHAEAARDFVMKELVTKTDLKNALLTQTVAFGVMLVTVSGILLALIKAL